MRSKTRGLFMDDSRLTCGRRATVSVSGGFGAHLEGRKAETRSCVAARSAPACRNGHGEAENAPADVQNPVARLGAAEQAGAFRCRFIAGRQASQIRVGHWH